MDFTIDETAEHKAWRQEVREFLDKELPPGYDFDWDYDEDDAGWEEMKAFWRKVGARGWVALTWPKEYYGQGRSAVEKWILNEEFCRRNAPDYPGIGMSVKDAVMRLGTHEQRLKHLEGIAKATILWGEGYTEPEAGSDLASLETRAVRDGDEWVINGQKTFGTAAHRTQWMAVFARTNPDVPKHAGLSMFVVPIDAPGLKMAPLYNLAGGRQNVTYFDDVRVPLDALVGDQDRAWQQVWFKMGGEELDRGGPAPSVRTNRMQFILDMLMEYCKETTRNGRPLSQDPVVRQQLAELAVGCEAIRMLDCEAYWRFETRQPSPFGAFLPQAVYKEFWPHFGQVTMDILGPLSLIQTGKWAPLAGAVDRYYRASFGNHAGGTSQTKRMVIATRGLGLPR